MLRSVLGLWNRELYLPGDGLPINGIASINGIALTAGVGQPRIHK